MKYTLSATTFKTKTNAINYVKKLLQDNPVGYSFRGSDLLLLLDLYEKCGKPQTTNMRIGKGKYNTKCFWADTEPFSYKKCFNPPTNKYLISKACRDLVYDQTKSFKQSKVLSNQLIQCQISRRYYNWDDIHVDHIFDKMLFKDMIVDFMLHNNYDIQTLKIQNDRFLKSEINTQWQQYHYEHSQLRCIHKHFNLLGVDPKKRIHVELKHKVLNV